MSSEKTFATAINCMDGRTQEPVRRYVMELTGADLVDAITDPGPIKELAVDDAYLERIAARVAISVEKHGSRHVFVVGHHDCAGNPVEQAVQEDEIRACLARLRPRFPQAEFAGIYVDSEWKCLPVRG